MNEDFQSALNSILSDPEKLESIQSLARQLSDSPPEPEKPSGGALGGLVEGLKSAFQPAKSGETEQLLRAMTPYMRPARQAKLERALRLTRLWHVAQTVLAQYGGEPDGL